MPKKNFLGLNDVKQHVILQMLFAAECLWAEVAEQNASGAFCMFNDSMT